MSRHCLVARVLSALVLSGLVVGCSPTPPLTISSPDAGVDAQAEMPDASATPDSGARSGRADRPFECPATLPLEDEYPDAPSRAPREACNADDLAAVRELFGGLDASPAALQERLTETCFECVVSFGADEELGPIVYVLDVPEAYYVANMHGCMMASGATEACARSLQDATFCGGAACDGCSPAQIGACSANAGIWEAEGPCGEATSRYQTDCRGQQAPWETCAMPSASNGDFFAHLVSVSCAPSLL